MCAGSLATTSLYPPSGSKDSSIMSSWQRERHVLLVTSNFASAVFAVFVAASIISAAVPSLLAATFS